MLNKELEVMYRHWKYGSKMVLNFCNKQWTVSIERTGSECRFADGWNEFAEAVKLVVGDTLVIYRASSTDMNMLGVCIFSELHYIDDDFTGISVNRLSTNLIINKF